MPSFTISANIVIIPAREIFYGELAVAEGKIASINLLNQQPDVNAPFLLPGFIDSHVHVESSMLVPSEFAKLAVVHGTTGTISDPHEIANVCGIDGVMFMIENGKTVPFKFHFGAPSCVPATIFETAGASLNAAAVEKLLANNDIHYLSEMMNFPGVLNGDKEVLDKLAAAVKYNKPVDGHAPGLMGEAAKKYIEAGISTDHECFTEAEALDKLQYGMKILVREGSAAKNFDALVNLLHQHHEQMMFCSDDKHPDSLVAGHINNLCARAVAAGVNVFKVLQVACINPVLHYKMSNGILRIGDAADFIVVDNLVDFNVQQTYIDGVLVAEEGKSLIETVPSEIINEFNCTNKSADDFSMPYDNEIKEIAVIEALDGQLITPKLMAAPLVKAGHMVSDVAEDIVKIAVVNRYKDAPVTKAFIKNIGIKEGALASSVAHDSHNIVVVGVDDESMAKAVNLIIEERGGVSAVSKNESMLLPLPVAGLMSNEDAYVVASQYTNIDRFAKEQLGSPLSAPFMTLSFMALLVIPHLKLSDKGLFDGDSFSFVN